jgi:hypothetical protein
MEIVRDFQKTHKGVWEKPALMAAVIVHLAFPARIKEPDMLVYSECAAFCHCTIRGTLEHDFVEQLSQKLQRSPGLKFAGQ